jgi:hypothetical protein
MKKVPYNKRFVWDTVRIHYLIRKRFKERYNRKITTKEVNAIWKTYIEEHIIKQLAVGQIVYLDKDTRIWVKATPITESKVAMSLLKKGLMYKGGRIVEAKINYDTSEYIYDIVLETRQWKHTNKLYFTPHPLIRKAVREGIIKGKLLTRTYVN